MRFAVSFRMSGVLLDVIEKTGKCFRGLVWLDEKQRPIFSLDYSVCVPDAVNSSP